MRADFFNIFTKHLSFAKALAFDGRGGKMVEKGGATWPDF
jgi:hypothetical protein